MSSPAGFGAPFNPWGKPETGDVDVLLEQVYADQDAHDDQDDVESGSHGIGPLHADLRWLLDGIPPPTEAPTYVIRGDGNALFYGGRVNGMFGDPECGKTWIALAGAVEALTKGERVAIIDVDHNGAEDTARRILALGATTSVIADPDRFRYYAPEDSLELRAVYADVIAWRPGYVVIDSVGEVSAMLGVKSGDPDAMTAVMRHFQQIANTGSCVVTIDHLPKDHDARSSGFATGTTAKKRAIRGAYLRVDRVRQFAVGETGKAALTIAKDHPSGLRSTSPGGDAGTFVMNATGALLLWHIELPVVDAQGHVKPTHDMGVCLEWLRRTPETAQSTSSVMKGTGLNGVRAKAAMEVLLVDGLVEREEVTRGTRVDSLWSPTPGPQPVTPV